MHNRITAETKGAECPPLSSTCCSSGGSQSSGAVTRRQRDEINVTTLVIAVNLVLSITVSAGVVGLLLWSIATQNQGRSAVEGRRHLQLVDSPRLDSLGLTERKAAA
jgi:hypothetical protein